VGKKKISLPDFKTLGEMANFFDKTDTTLIEGFEEIDIQFVKTEDALPVRRGTQKKSSAHQADQ
jgi:hypothetical protein